MRDFAVLLFHLIATGAKLFRRGSVLLYRRRVSIVEAPAVGSQPVAWTSAESAADGSTDGSPVRDWLRPDRLLRAEILIRPTTIMSFHRTLVEQKHSRLFTPTCRGKPGPRGPSEEIIAAIVEMKRIYPRFDSRRIAQQLSFAFGLEIDKDVVRRVLAKHYRPGPSAPVCLPIIRPGDSV